MHQARFELLKTWSLISLAPALTCSLLPWSWLPSGDASLYFVPGTSFACPALSPCPLGVFSTTLLLCLGFGTRDGRGSGMRYFRALAYVPPTPRLSVEEARSAGSVAPQTLPAQDGWASPATAAHAASESVASLAGERGRRCASPRSRQGASARRGARAAFFCGTQDVLGGVGGDSFQRSGLAGFGILRCVV